MSAKLRAPVISLLSSDDEVELPAPRKRKSSSALKENVKPRKRSTSREPTGGKASRSVSDTSTKATAITERSKSSINSKLPPKVQNVSMKVVDPITISSSPPASPPPAPPPKVPHHAQYTKSYPKIFEGLSSDPILSQSSPVALPSQSIAKPREPVTKTKTKTVLDDLLGSSSENGLSDEDRVSPKRPLEADSKGKGRATSSVLSKETQELLRRLHTENAPEVKRRRIDRVDLQISSSPEPAPTSTAPGRRSKLTEAEKAARAAERDAARVAKAAEKEAQKLQKQAERERKVLERTESQAISAANKIKNSHKDTIGEMVVDVSTDLYTSTTGIQLRALLTEIKVHSHAPFDSSLPCIVKWRRAVNSDWDPKSAMFIPCPLRFTDETHLLMVIQAKEFVALTNAPGELDVFVAKIKTAYPTCKPIILIEGLIKLINKSKSNKSRAYSAQVRNHIREDGGREKVRIDRAAEAVDEDAVEDALLELQVIHECLIWHTQDGTYTAESIGFYTQQLSIAPHKHARSVLNNSVNFCMDTKQVSCGKTVDEVYNKMLQTVHMSTPGIATAIQSEYPTIQELFKAFMDHGEDVLKDIRVARTGNGRALGPAMSRKIARILTGTDEWELES
ncbi:hypothetical protein TWF730_006611 [Orbilia blumenaviensis]|uniref:ERCC4 domain-containing protein n=1 Tax=Orbilia blumenaviensis TaxID=1796055 RepID=A0AAV9VH37_9PEZI